MLNINIDLIRQPEGLNWPTVGGGGLTESQLFCKIVKTKLTFVNGQKCDETHNT